MKDKLINSLNGMGMGLLATLVIGTIIRQIGTLFHLELLIAIGGFSTVLMAAAIGAGVAMALDAKPATIFACIATATIGAGAIRAVEGSMVMGVGEPAGAYIAAVATALVGNLAMGRTKVDILVVPLLALIAGGAVALYVSPLVSYFTGALGTLINQATMMRPLFMGMIIAVIFCFVILSPLSSAALAVGLGLTGLAGGAAVAGCASSMVGFAVISYKENGFGGLLSQGIGTSKIQFGNFVKNPMIAVPTLIAAAVAGPVSTTLLGIQTNSLGAGMGTSGLVGQIQTVAEMGISALPLIVTAQILVPAIVSLLTAKLLQKWGRIRHGDMILPK